MLHSSTLELSQGAGTSISSEFVSADDISVSHLVFRPSVALKLFTSSYGSDI